MRPLLILACSLSLAGCRAMHAQEAGFTPLFDGTSFDGWEGDHSLFRVEDGALVAGTLEAHIDANAFLCTTKEYSDFDLRFEARLVGPGDNAGVQFRSRRVPDHHEVSGYQADMGTVSRAWFYDVIGMAGDTEGPDAPAPIWGAIYDETRRNRYIAWSMPDDVAAVLKPGDWNEMRVLAEGPHIQIWLNGYQTVDFTEVAHIPGSGVICLQIHSGASAEAWHREIVLKELGGGE